MAFCFVNGSVLTTVCDHLEDHSLDYTDLCQQSMSLVLHTLSRFVVAFLPRSKCLLISWLQSPSAVILEPKKRKPVTMSPFSLLHAMRLDRMIFSLFSILSRLLITFLPRSNNLLISWLQSSSAVILELKKIKSVTVSIVSPSICYEGMGADAMILVL